MELVHIFASPSYLLGIAVILLAFYLLYSTAYAPYQVLRPSTTGIPRGPTPLPFFGNSLELRKMGLIKFFERNYKKYGPVYRWLIVSEDNLPFTDHKKEAEAMYTSYHDSTNSYYIGRLPVVVVADLELVKEITVKKFENFMDKPLLGHPALIAVGRDQSFGLALEEGNTWKEHRAVLSPNFSALKIKAMLPLIKRSCDCLVELLGECTKSRESIDILSMYKKLSLEIILAVAFGRVMSVQRGEGDQLLKAMEGVFLDKGGRVTHSEIISRTIMSNFPWLEKPLSYVAQRSKKGQSIKLIRRLTTELVKLRRADREASKHRDFLQLMIDARVDSGSEANGDVSKTRLTDMEITSQSMTFLVAGLHTVSHAMSYASYHLALHPDVQDRLRTEIDDYFRSNPDKPLYDALQDLKYLDMVVNETIRLSSNPKRDRFCLKTTKIGDYTIPKGAVVHIPSHLIHRLPDYWNDPYKFDPDRFTPEEKAKRPPLSFMPFGWGPRHCIGIRFALMEVKLVLTEILKKYKFVRSPDTEVPLKLMEGVTLMPVNGVRLRIEARD